MISRMTGRQRRPSPSRTTPGCRAPRASPYFLVSGHDEAFKVTPGRSTLVPGRKPSLAGRRGRRCRLTSPELPRIGIGGRRGTRMVPRAANLWVRPLLWPDAAAGLAGHSDGGTWWPMPMCDALLSAAGALGDLWRPVSVRLTRKWAGASGLTLLRREPASPGYGAETGFPGRQLSRSQLIGNSPSDQADAGPEAEACAPPDAVGAPKSEVFGDHHRRTGA